MPFHRETLLAFLSVFGQCSICKSEAPGRSIFIYHVNNLAAVEGPKSEMLDGYGYGFAGLNGRIRPAEPDTRNIKHFPLTQPLHRSVKYCRTVAKVDAALQDCVAGG